MRLVIQRVRRGKVSVAGRAVAEIGAGLVILVGVGRGDGPEEADWLADKVAGLRVFEDAAGKSNLSIIDVGGSALVVSQFTLYADARKGRRPSFIQAALPEVAEPLVRGFADRLAANGIPTQTGKFGAHMLVEIDNDGPVTVLLEREPHQVAEEPYSTSPPPTPSPRTTGINMNDRGGEGVKYPGEGQMSLATDEPSSSRRIEATCASVRRMPAS